MLVSDEEEGSIVEVGVGLRSGSATGEMVGDV